MASKLAAAKMATSGRSTAVSSAASVAFITTCWPFMGRMHTAVFTPDPRSADVYDQLYAEYVRLHDYLGRGANQVMHRLRALRDRVQQDQVNRTAAAGPATEGALR